MKPEKPKKKLFAKNKALEKAVALSKNTPADTKALDGARKELDKTTKKLEVAMNNSFKAHDKAFQMFPDIAKTPSPGGPVPIPYPTILKIEKDVKSAVKGTEKAFKEHEKAQKKAVKVIDKELKTLESTSAKTTGDKAGTIKGLVSFKNSAKTQFTMFSMNVKAEGKNVNRFFDILHQNEKKAK